MLISVVANQNETIESDFDGRAEAAADDGELFSHFWSLSEHLLSSNPLCGYPPKGSPDIKNDRRNSGGTLQQKETKRRYFETFRPTTPPDKIR